MKNIKEKQERLLELYINGLISKEDFIRKKEVLEIETIQTEKLIKENVNEEPMSRESIKNKIKTLKKVIKKSYVSLDNDITDEFLSEFVNNIKVKQDRFEWNLSIFNDKVNMDKERTLLTRLVLSKDDVGRYFALHYKGSYNRVKEHIYVDIYI